MKFVRSISLLLLIFLGLFLIFFRPVSAQAISGKDTVEIDVFVRNGCQHCQDEELFLGKQAKERSDITVKYYRLENQSERQIWDKFTTRLGISKITPITVVGKKYLIGFNSPADTGKEILSLISAAVKNKIPTDVDGVDIQEAGQKSSVCPDDGSVPCVDDSRFYFVSLPFIGKINTQKYPLLFLSALLGFFDGFNPCAMWVLITFLIILIEVGDRKKIFIFAGTFILAEAIMYSLILTVWFKTWDFVKLDNIVTPIVGMVSVLGGFFFLNEWRKKEIECKVSNIAHRAKTRQKIQKLVESEFNILVFLGILGIALSVNIIEFACSIGIPQAFTKILELNKLSPLSTILFIAVYILFYMVDDLFVFALALYGADKLHLTTKYSKLSNLIGGIVMLILGFLLIFKSQVLFF